MDTVQKELESIAKAYFTVQAAQMVALKIRFAIEQGKNAGTKENEEFWTGRIDKLWDDWNESVMQAYPNNQAMVDHMSELVDFHIVNPDPNLTKGW